MDIGAPESAAFRLERAQQFLRHASILAVASLVLTAVVSIQVQSASVPLALLTAGEGLVVLCSYYSLRDLIERLALEPLAEDLPAVQRYRRRLLEQSERDRLAASINSLIAEATTPGAFSLADRIVLFEDELRTLARHLATPEVSVQVRSMVICARLLSRGVESPLFNPNVPVEHLRAILLRIRHGIGRH
jgi:hypothetical protein